MKQLFVLLSFLLSSFIPIAASPGNVQQTYEIYYLAVGNSHYATDKTARGFKNLEGANKSARKVAAYLNQAGAVAGITLISEPNRLITRKDVLKALDDLLARVKRATTANPLVIFYFCGHGISEGIGWNHFSVPGDFVPPERINIDTLMEAAIYAGEVSDAIEKQKLPCLLLLDSCYEGENVNLPDTVISQQLAKNLTDIFKVLRHMNEFRGPSIAVFSTRPGTVVSTVQDPIDSDAPLGVGPLARRVMLSFEQAIENKRSLTIGGFLQQMSSPTFDPVTPSILTLSKPEHPNMRLINYRPSKKSSGELRMGTGAPPKLSSGVRKSPPRPAPPVRQVKYNISPFTYLSIQGDPSENVSGGKTLKFSAQNVSYEVELDEPDQITLSINDGGPAWEIGFISPSGKALGVGTYKNAQRARFQEGTRPGFTVSGDGRGCSEVEAQFTILNLKRDLHGKLTEFDADFWQRCDGAAAVLRGQLRFRATTQITK